MGWSCAAGAGSRNRFRAATASGAPEWSFKIEPPIITLLVRKNTKETNVLRFSDEDMANRVAKAMLHAVELCGGSKPEPF